MAGFDLNDPEQARVIKGSPESRMEFDESDTPEQTGHELDSQENTELHSKLLSYHQRELDRQYENRTQQAIDEDYYDNDQWSEDEKIELSERGQAAICWNVVQQTCNWVIGSEKRGRTDFKVLPRRKEDAKPAERKSQLLKYLSDVNRTPFHRSRAFEDTVKVGIGWLEDAVTDNDDGEPVYSRYESWRNMLWDSASTEYDLSDARYVIRFKFIDLDIAKAIFPERAELLERSAAGTEYLGFGDTNGDEISDFAEEEAYINTRGAIDHNQARDRVRLIEIWYRTPTKVKRFSQGERAGELFDETNPQHVEEVQLMGESVLADRTSMQMHVAIMTAEGLVYKAQSPYRHNRFPFTPIWGYRRGRDNMPYGIIRSLRDIQDDINKKASRAQFILAATRVVMEEGAVEDTAELMGEIGRPDAVIVLKNGNKRFEINPDDRDIGPHMELMSRGISMVQQVSGVTDELMGRATNATSGVAVQARQEQGAMSTSKLFDNLRFAVQTQGEKQLSLIEQWFTEQKQFRITNSRGTPEYVEINDGLPENDIIRSQADFVIGDAEWRATIRQANAEQLMEMMTRMPPEVSMVILDLVVESMDLPNREEIVNRIRQVTGQRDPDATEMTPEEQERIAQQQAAQQKAQQQQEEMFQAQLRKLVADALRSEAAAQRDAATVAKTNVGVQKDAVETAQLAMQAPRLLSVADGIMAEAGYVSATDAQRMQQEQAMQEQAMAEQQAAEQAAMEQQQMQQPQQPEQPIQ